MERAERKLAEARAKASRLSERNRTLEEALWAVEWVHLGYLGYNVYRCPWCGATLPERGEPKHRPDCQRQVALAGPEPGGD